MPYCLKCGTKVEDAMTFCPNCGMQLKDAVQAPAPTTPTDQAPAVAVDQPTPKTGEDKPQKTEAPKQLTLHKRVDFSFIKYLAAGLILITFGVSAIMELTNPALASVESLEVMLLIMCFIVGGSAAYYFLAARRHI